MTMMAKQGKRTPPPRTPAVEAAFKIVQRHITLVAAAKSTKKQRVERATNAAEARWEAYRAQKRKQKLTAKGAT